MKNFIFLLIYLFAQFTHADFATTKRVVQADVIQGTKSVENYIKDSPPKAANTKGWKCYADAAGVVPVDGVGGTSTVTFTSSSTTPLKNSGGGFIFTHLASNQQGMGCSYDFVIDPQDKAKMLDVNLEYILRSGTFNAGGVGIDSDLEVFVYDVTNAAIVGSLSSNKLLSNNTTLSDLFSASFQSASNSTSYRLILHSSTTTTSAFTIGFGDISVARSKYVYGTPVTDWVSYTPTGTWIANTTYAGKKRRVGDSYEYDITVSLSGAPTSATLLVNIPDNIDTTKFSSASLPTIGYGTVTDSGTTNYPLSVITNGTTQVIPIASVASGTYSSTTALSQVIPFTFGAGDIIQFHFSVPIVGLSASVQMSDQANLNTLAATYSVGTGASTTLNTPINFDTKLSDPSGLITVGVGSWKATAQTPGTYRISGSIATSGTPNIRLWKNGVAQLYLITIGSGGPISSYSAEIFLNSGDYIDLRPDSTVTPTGGSLGTYQSTFSFSKLSGSATIAATESVNFKYSTTAGQSIANPFGSQVVWGTKDWDTHGMMNTSTGTWTFPVQGKYKVCAGLDYVSAVITAGNQRNVQFYKNGAAINYVINYPLASVTQAIAVFGCNLYNVVAGDTGAIWTNANESAARSLSTSGFTNYITLERVGN